MGGPFLHLHQYPEGQFHKRDAVRKITAEPGLHVTHAGLTSLKCTAPALGLSSVRPREENILISIAI